MLAICNFLSKEATLASRSLIRVASVWVSSANWPTLKKTKQHNAESHSPSLWCQMQCCDGIMQHHNLVTWVNFADDAKPWWLSVRSDCSAYTRSICLGVLQQQQMPTGAEWTKKQSSIQHFRPMPSEQLLISYINWKFTIYTTFIFGWPWYYQGWRQKRMKDDTWSKDLLWSNILTWTSVSQQQWSVVADRFNRVLSFVHRRRLTGRRRERWAATLRSLNRQSSAFRFNCCKITTFLSLLLTALILHWFCPYAQKQQYTQSV